MKNTFRSVFVLCLLAPMMVHGQSDLGKCTIAAVGRYSVAGTELRWIPDNKTILRLGFDNSYTIERSDSGSNRFQVIGIVKAFSRLQWDTLIIDARNAEAKSNRELAADFLFGEKQSEPNTISLDKGIAELNDQKAKEDMLCAVFVL